MSKTRSFAAGLVGLLVQAAYAYAQEEGEIDPITGEPVKRNSEYLGAFTHRINMLIMVYSPWLYTCNGTGCCFRNNLPSDLPGIYLVVPPTPRKIHAHHYHRRSILRRRSFYASRYV